MSLLLGAVNLRMETLAVDRYMYLGGGGGGGGGGGAKGHTCMSFLAYSRCTCAV